MSASKWHVTSGTMINPSDTKGSLGKHSPSPQRWTNRSSGSHENSAEHSPLHHQQRIANRVGGFSPWETKVSSEGGHIVASNTPGRSPLKVSGRPDESPEKGTVVPKFGDWDENNPSSGDAFTDLFDKVSEERQTSAAKVPMIIDDSMYLNNYHHDTSSNKSTKCCCFNWGRK